MGYKETTERYFDDSGRWLDTKTRIETWAPDGAPDPKVAPHWSRNEEKDKSHRGIIQSLLDRLGMPTDKSLLDVDPELLIDAMCNQLWLRKHKRTINKSDPHAAFKHQLRLGYTMPVRCAEILRDITRELRPPEPEPQNKKPATKEEWAKFQRQIAEFLEQRGK